MLISYHQNAGQNNNMKTINMSFENEAQFRYFSKLHASGNKKKRLNVGNACYLSSRTFHLPLCYMKT
jgi:hypothetical protein